MALCHAGISKIGPAGADENAGLALAEVGGIDAIFVGHQHLLLPGADFAGLAGVDAERGRLAGVPAVMAGFWGGHIGVIDLTLERARRRLARRERERRVCGRSRRTTVARSRGPRGDGGRASRRRSTYVRAPVGEVDEPLTSYFAMIGDDPSVRIVHDAQLWYARNAHGDASPRWTGAPLLSASAPFKCGGRNGVDYYTESPAGAIALRNVADLYVYPNGLRVVKATGATVREWLERSASVFRRLDPSRDAPQPLLEPNFAAYDFDSIAGVTYRLDPTQPARYDEQGRIVAANAHRVVDLCFEGRPIDEARDVSRRHQFLSRQRRRPFSRLRRRVDRLRGAGYELRRAASNI